MEEDLKKLVVGIDVSKSKLDVHVGGEHFVVLNDVEGFESLAERLQPYEIRLVAMEATGGYEADVALALSQQGFAVAILNPRQVRDFARASGYLAKTDKIDARIIAEFAEKLEVEPQVLSSEVQTQLRELVKRRRQVVGMLKRDKNRLEQARSQRVRKSIKAHVKYLEGELAGLDDDIDGAVKASDAYVRKTNFLESVPGVSSKTSAVLLAELPELGQVSNKRIAMLVGLAPLNRDSGTLRGRRTTWGGRPSVRAALYMPTLAAIRWNPTIKAAYDRMVAAGKPRMTAVVAMMRKLLVTLNALLRKETVWQPQQA